MTIPIPRTALPDALREVTTPSPGLAEWFAPFGRVMVAYSGGVDSALVAWCARQALGAEGVLAVIADSPSLPRRELMEAVAFAREHDIPCRLVTTGEGSVPGYIQNGPDRCYFCKHELYDVLRRVAAEESGSAGAHPFDAVVNGTNRDDTIEWRPGLAAAAEFEVRSPLLECGLDKEAVRALSRAAGLLVWDKPALPCLASRIPYGTPVTPDRLARVEAAEEVLREAGFRVFRVRYHGGTARLEIGDRELGRLEAPTLRTQVFERIRGAGFRHVELDPEPYRRGRLNEGMDSSPARSTT